MIGYMKRSQNLLVGILLSIIACLFVIVTATPSQAVNKLVVANQISVANYQKEAELELLAQTDGSKIEALQLKRFTAILSGDEIFPAPISTSASGTLGAVLNGNRLIVRGDFRNLSSPLRDYAADPSTQVIPKVTTAVHIHRGSAQQNGPTEYSLQVMLESNGLSGRVKGDQTLTDDQLKALNNGLLYIDIHTKGFRLGELRGILKA